MINLIAEVENGLIVRRGLEDLEREIPLIARSRIYDALRRVLTRMRKEPPQMASYTRTGLMRSGWPYRPVRLGPLAYTLYNDVDHTRYVVGDAEGLNQAWFHVGRWENFREVVEEELENLPQEAERAIELYASHALS